MNTLLSIALHKASRKELPVNKLLILFRSILSKPIPVSSKVELIFEMASIGAEGFNILTSQLASKINDVILQAGYNRLKLLLLHLAYICPECFTKFIDLFREPLSSRLIKRHFNDVIQLAIEIARVNEELGVIFVRNYSKVFLNLSKNEGISHLSQVVLYIAKLGYRKLAWQIFDGLVDTFINQGVDSVKLAWLLRTLSKVDNDFLNQVVNRLRDPLLEIINRSSESERKKFMSIICKDKNVQQQIRSSLKFDFELECLVY